YSISSGVRLEAAAPVSPTPVASCHAPTNTNSSSSDTNAARRCRLTDFISGRLADREAVEVFLRPGRVEHLAHDGVLLVGGAGLEVLAHVLHVLARIGDQEHLLGDLLVVPVALDVATALHLRENPHRHPLQGHGVEVGAVGHVLDLAKAV